MTTKKTRLTTTLALLKQHRACASGYKILLASLPANYPQDKPISLLHILESNGVQDMMWALRATKDEPKVRVAICADMAARALKHFEARYPNDKRPRDCIKACRLFVRGKISLKALQKAASAADAAYAASAADYAAADAAYAAASAAYAATDAASAASAADYAAGIEKERAAQARIIKKYLA